MPTDIVTMDKIVALCKRRGFIFPASEIYGGIASTYDFGHYGVLLKNNVKGEWWRAMLQERDDVVALDSAIIQHPRTWEASGHLASFTDPLVDCRSCKQRFREDHLDRLSCPRKPSVHPGEFAECSLTAARDFNLMFRTTVGPVEETGATVYLRPETAQGIFLNFKNVLSFARKKPPFGIAQVGKSFRNEITPQNFIFRLREFEQMEMEFFCKPGTDEDWHRHWIEARHRWYIEALGIRPERLRVRPHDADELSHYSKATSDIEYEFPFGWGELEGIANRTDFDLRAHQEHSREDLSYLDPENQERYLPFVIEPAAGVDRIMITILLDAYDEEEVRGETRVVLHLHPAVAPVQAAVMPLSKKEELIGPARDVLMRLKTAGVRTEYDQTGGNIGKRYRRQDEIGTPFCVTVDFETATDGAVTIRERDSMEQERVPVADLVTRLRDRLS